MGTEGARPAVGTGDAGSREISGAGDKGCANWGFQNQQGQVAEVRTFSMGSLFSS